jgi:hypothetical protein
MATLTLKKQSIGMTSTKSVSTERKSKTALFWEKYPSGIITVYDRRAVNK